LIDAFVLPIGELGGKALQEEMVRLYGRQAVLSFCEAGGNLIADTIKKLITGSWGRSHGTLCCPLSRQISLGNPAAVRLGLSAVVAGLVFVVAALARVQAGGQDVRAFALAIVLGIVIIGGVAGYAYLWRRNSAVFVANGRVGITNAFNMRFGVPASEVDHLERAVEEKRGRRGMSIRIPVVLIVTKDRRHPLRFRAADSLEPGGLERIAAILGVPIWGSWS
jgi:hypothetical protein